MQVHFIDTSDKLIDICQQLSHSQFLAVDTEFVRQTTYYPILALIQLCDNHRIAIIDPLAINDLSPLLDILYDKKITKVLHSARQDMEIFYYLKQSVPQSIFDTQICAALLGYGEQIGYASLVKQMLQVNLDKSQTRTDWLQRPLSQKQVDYAADDVRYLARIYPLQIQKLHDLKRSSWLDKDFQFLSSDKTYAPSPETIWKKVKGITKLKKRQLAIIKNLAAFREQLALKQNRPRRRVIADDTLIDLAINPPVNLKELQERQKLSPKFLQYNGDTLLTLIKQGLNTEESHCPQLPVYQKLSQDEQALADCLMAIVHLCAKNNNISPQSLCSRKELDALIKGHSKLNVLSGWRNELIGKQLLQFLAGELQLSYVSGQLLLN